MSQHLHEALHEALAHCWLRPCGGVIWLIVDTHFRRRELHRTLERMQDDLTPIGGYRYRVGAAILEVLTANSGEQAFQGQLVDHVVSACPLPPRIAEEVLHRLAYSAA